MKSKEAQVSKQKEMVVRSFVLFILMVSLGACGGGSPTSPTPVGPPTSTRNVINSLSGIVASRECIGLRVSVADTSAGTLDGTAEWTVVADQVNVFLVVSNDPSIEMAKCTWEAPQVIVNCGGVPATGQNISGSGSPKMATLGSPGYGAQTGMKAHVTACNMGPAAATVTISVGLTRG